VGKKFLALVSASFHAWIRLVVSGWFVYRRMHVSGFKQLEETTLPDPVTYIYIRVSPE
jgi:hypothetical protein